MNKWSRRILSFAVAVLFLLGGNFLLPALTVKVSAASPVTIGGATPPEANGIYTATGSPFNGADYYLSQDGGSSIYYDPAYGGWVLHIQHWVYYYAPTADKSSVPSSGWLKCSSRDTPGSGVVDASFYVLGGATYSFSASTMTVAEPTNGDGDLTIGIPVTITGNVNYSTCNYTVSGGTATKDVDYFGGGTLATNGGTPSTTLYVTIADDLLVESSETFVVTLSGGGAIPSCTVTITDNDVYPTVQFSASTSSVAENASSPTVTVSLSAPAAEPVTAHIQSADGTATAGSDYTAVSQNITIPTGSSSITVPLLIADDSVYEPNETFTLTLSSPGKAILGAKASHTVTITDNDYPEIFFSAASSSISESGSAVNIGIALSNPSSVDVTAVITTVDGTAKSGADYTALSQSVTIPAGNLGTSVSVPILQDGIYESPEQFNVSFVSASGATIREPHLHPVTITDDESMPTASLTATTAEVDESQPSVAAVITLSGASSSSITVDYATADGTAKAGSDYTATSGTVTFAPGETQKTVLIPVLDDSVYEGNQSFTLSISNVSGATLAASSASFTIDDNEAVPQLSLDSSSQSVTESDGTISFAVTLSGLSETPVTCSYAATGVNATEGVDFGTASGTLTIPAGQTTASFTVDITQDAIDEPDELFVVSLSSPSGATLGAIHQTGVTITDDEETPTVSFSSGSASVSEDDSSLVIDVVLSGPSSETMQFAYSTENGTADAGSDYTAASGIVTFAPGETSAQIVIPILNDLTYEGTESFVVNLLNGVPSGGAPVPLDFSPAVPILLDSITVSILDDEPIPTVSLLSIPAVSEGDGNARITVELSGLSATDTVVNFATSDGSALDTKDYTGLSGSVTIPAGELSADVLIPILPDAVYEDTETFGFAITSAVGADLSSSLSGDATITDDDAFPTVQIHAASLLVNEDIGSLKLTITLSGAADRDLLVAFDTADNTAKAGIDYSGTTGSVLIPAGETSVVIDVPIINDTVVQADRSFSFRAAILDDHGTVIPGTDATAAVTIHSEDVAPTPTVTSAPTVSPTPAIGTAATPTAGATATPATGATATPGTGVLGTSRETTKTGETDGYLWMVSLTMLGLVGVLSGIERIVRKRRGEE